MSGNYYQIGNIELAVSALLMVIALFLSRLKKAGLEKDLLTGTLRCFAQLMAIGYILKIIFDANRWYWVLLVLAVMITVAGFEAVRRDKKQTPGFQPVVIGAIGGSTLFVMALSLLFIVRVRPWYNPQYVIPMMGMLISNAMNGASLLMNRIRGEFTANRDLIEAKLSLGATGKQAVEGLVASAIRAAMIPAINYLMVIGLVALPGMMTGQIIAGASPIESVRYQIAIMYMITAANAITIYITAHFASRGYFTGDHQLRDELL